MVNGVREPAPALVLRIRVLGTVTMTYGSEPVLVGRSARLQALIAYLILHTDAPQSRKHLAFLFWPDSTEGQAHTNLRKLLHDLRHTLPDPDRFLLFDGDAVQWNPDSGFHADVVELERLLKAVAANPLDRDALIALIGLYTGDLLPGCYDEWVLAQRQRYQREVHLALEHLVTLLENQRAYPDGIRFAHRLLELDPAEERTYQRLMRLYALNGDRTRAIQTYHECVDRLRHELEVEPGPETQRLYEQVLNREVSAPAGDRAEHAGVLRMIDRQLEWERLAEAWKYAAQGRVHLAVISGDAGVGKTRLAEEMLIWASHQGAITARTHAYALHNQLAYTPVAELLRNPTLFGRLPKLAEQWLVETTRILPELLETRPDLPTPAPMREAWERQRFLDSLTRGLLADDQPLVVLFDDLQWCDPATIEWLHHLLTARRNARLLVLATLRREEVDAPISALLDALRRQQRLTQIELTPLNAADSWALATQTAGQALTAHQAAQLFQATEGNPLFIVETVRAHLPAGTDAAPGSWEVTLAPRLQAAILERLDQLTGGARELAALAATIGRAFTFGVLMAVSEQDEETLVPLLDELWRRRIILEQGADAYDFSHTQIREVAYGGISHARRRLWHRRIAEALEQLSGPAANRQSLELAYHFERAGNLEKAVAYYQAAAASAQAIFAMGQVVEAATRGIALLGDLPPAPAHMTQEALFQSMLGTGLAHVKGYRAPDVEAAYARARLLYQQLGATPALLPVLIGGATFHLIRGEISLSAEMSRELFALAQHLQHGDLLTLAHFACGATSYYLGALRDAVAHLEAAFAMVEAQPHHGLVPFVDHRISCLNHLALTFWFMGDVARSLQCSQDALSLAEPLQQPYVTVMTLHFAGVVHQLCGDAAATKQLTSRAIEITGPDGPVFQQALNAVLWGWVCAEEGDAEAGIAHLQAAFTVLDRLGSGLERPYYLSMLAHAQNKAGQHAAAAASLQEATERLRHGGDFLWEPELFRQRGELYRSQGAPPAEIEAELRQALAAARRLGAKSLELRAATSMGWFLLGEGRRAEAQMLLDAIYPWFAAKTATRDLYEAQALAQALS